MKKFSNNDIQSMRLLIRYLLIYYNYDKTLEEVSKTHSSTYLLEKEEYCDKIFQKLPEVFKGKSEKEIYSILLKLISEEL